jgi:periplasmic binding family protein
VAPISEAITEEFRKEQPNVDVTVGTSGTGGGFTKFCNGETDVSDASRAIKDVDPKFPNEKIAIFARTPSRAPTTSSTRRSSATRPTAG